MLIKFKSLYGIYIFRFVQWLPVKLRFWTALQTVINILYAMKGMPRLEMIIF